MKAKFFFASFLATLILAFAASCTPSVPGLGGGGKVGRTNKALMGLNLGMTKSQVYKLAGTADKIEGYDWGSVWFYRTGGSSGSINVVLDGDDDKNFTPVVFDISHRVTGFGQKFYDRTIQDLGTGQF